MELISVIICVCLACMSICLGYYSLCAAYAGTGSSFIWIWLVGAGFFAVIAVLLMVEKRGVLVIPSQVKLIGGIVIGVLAVVFVVAEGCVISGMRSKPDENTDYLLVLGCQIRGTKITKSLRYRLDTAYDYAKSNASVRIIVSGGQGPGEDMTEAEAMMRYLMDRGIARERIIMEDRSTDTAENMRFSVRYIEDKSARVCVVTNDFHVFRAKKLARAQGLTNVSGAPARSDSILFYNYMVREAVGVVKDFVFGNF